MKKKVLTFLVFLVATQAILGQQDAQYTQYMYNTLTVNPAYAGSREVLSVAVLHRSQWLAVMVHRPHKL